MKTFSKLAVAIVCGLISVAFMMVSCKQSAEKQKEKELEKAMEKCGGEKADVNIEDLNITIESEGNKIEIKTGAEKWPADAPGDVPELQAGTIIGTTISESNEGRNWSVRYSGVTMDDLNEYAATLKNKGFKIQTIKAPKGGMVNGEKGNIGIIFTVSQEVSVLAIVEQKE